MARSVKKVMVAFGTRPEAIKLAPVVNALKKISNLCTVTLITAQHRSMLDEMLKVFKIKVDYDLNIMKPKQKLTGMSSQIIRKLSPIYDRTKPDVLLIQGDTMSAFLCALVAFYKKIPIGHIEAGLRSYDKYAPFPEEVARRLISTLADLHFAPTNNNRLNLISEGINKSKIFVTGNTVVDALKSLKDKKFVPRFLSPILRKKTILVTAHRRENFGKPLINICHALKEITEKIKEIEIIYPVHPNPNVRDNVYRILKNIRRIHLIDPLNYVAFINVLARSYLVLTDSGGIQEEAPVFGVPVLVLRNTTERPEVIKSGNAKLVGTEKKMIMNYVNKLVLKKDIYKKMANPKSPYGDGKAAQRIVREVERFLKKDE